MDEKDEIHQAPECFMGSEAYVFRRQPDGTIEVMWSPPLSDIELKDIRISEEQFERGESTLYSSIEEMKKNIFGNNGEEENTDK